MIWTVLYMILFELLIVLSVCAMLFLSGQCSKKNCSFSLRKHEEPNIQAFLMFSAISKKETMNVNHYCVLNVFV